MVRQLENLRQRKSFVIETELFALRVNYRFGFFWLARKAIWMWRFFFSIVAVLFATIFGKYELVREVGPGLPPEPVRPPTSQLEADQNLRRGIFG